MQEVKDLEGTTLKNWMRSSTSSARKRLFSLSLAALEIVSGIQASSFIGEALADNGKNTFGDMKNLFIRKK